MVAGMNFSSLPRLRPYPVRGHRLLYAWLYAVIALLSYQSRVLDSTTPTAAKECKQQPYNGPKLSAKGIAHLDRQLPCVLRTCLYTMLQA